ncbi:tRNA (adenosine(37)-N6)-threonylcarbamoyltransferase complex ATPase subunit type 1 TsaE [Thiolapillus sp.]
MSDSLHLFAGSEQEQMAQGAALAAAMGQRPLLIFLRGDLGTGKTTLVRGLLRGRGYEGPVRSPTYTLVEPYEFPGGELFHLDLYRLVDPEELEFLGGREIFSGAHQMLVEWPARGEGWLPEPDLEIRFAHQEQGRELLLTALTEKGQAVIRGLS